MTARGAATLSYDDNGNLIGDGANSYTWDARNRLSALSGAATASFQYDAFGRRVSKTVGGQSVSYLYDGANVVQEQAGGAATANLLTGGVDEVFSRSESTGTQSLLLDGLGSTLALADGSGVARRCADKRCRSSVVCQCSFVVAADVGAAARATWQVACNRQRRVSELSAHCAPTSLSKLGSRLPPRARRVMTNYPRGSVTPNTRRPQRLWRTRLSLPPQPAILLRTSRIKVHA